MATWERHAEERKPATVLFADVTGSTALTEQLDPEDAHEVLDGARKRICAAIESYRGTICRVTGDGVMAVFGAPVASERHALDACAAACEMQQKIRQFSDEISGRFDRDMGQDPIGSLVKSFLSISPGSEEAARRALNTSVNDGRIRDDEVVFLNDLLDLPQPSDLNALYDAMDNATRLQGRQRVACILLETASKTGPALVIIEDAHWADSVTLDHLAAFAKTVTNCPSILVLTSRIEGEQLLDSGCIASSYLWFHRDAMELFLETEQWDAVEHHAQSLAEYTESEPLS